MMLNTFVCILFWDMLIKSPRIQVFKALDKEGICEGPVGEKGWVFGIEDIIIYIVLRGFGTKSICL